MKILICIPTYNLTVSIKTMRSLFNTIQLLEKEGHEVEYVARSGSHINRVRNELASLFLQTKFDYCLFIDSDVWNFEKAVPKMIKLQAKVSCCTYPRKEHGTAGGPPPNCNLTDHAIKAIYEGFTVVPVKHCGGGCLLITRQVLLHMIHEKDISYNGGSNGFEFPLFDFFQSFIHNGVYLSEDYGFCQRLAELNILIACVSDVPLGHDEYFNSLQYYVKNAKPHHKEDRS